MATNTNITVTTASAFIPELWASDTIMFREKNLIFAGLVDTHWRSQLKYGDTLHIPNVSELAARFKSANTAVSYEALTEVTTDIVINKHYYAAFLVESIAELQANQSQMSTYSGQLGYVLGKQVDTDLAGLPDDFSQNVGTLTVGLTDEDVRRAIQYLDDADHPNEERFFGFSPAEKMNLLAIDKYVNTDYNVASVKQARGMFGTIYDIPCYASTNIEGSNGAGHDNFLMHRSALALVMQQDVKTESARSIDDLGDKVVAHNVYGFLEIRDTAGVWMKGK